MAATVTLRPGLLDRLRRFSGIATDDALAAAIGVPPETLTRVERGEEAPSLALIAGIASAFGHSLGEVATLTEAPGVATHKAAS